MWPQHEKSVLLTDLYQHWLNNHTDDDDDDEGDDDDDDDDDENSLF